MGLQAPVLPSQAEGKVSLHCLAAIKPPGDFDSQQLRQIPSQELYVSGQRLSFKAKISWPQH